LTPGCEIIYSSLFCGVCAVTGTSPEGGMKPGSIVEVLNKENITIKKIKRPITNIKEDCLKTNTNHTMKVVIIVRVVMNRI